MKPQTPNFFGLHPNLEFRKIKTLEIGTLDFGIWYLSFQYLELGI